VCVETEKSLLKDNHEKGKMMIMIVETPQVGSLAAEDKGEDVGGRGLSCVGIVAPSSGNYTCHIISFNLHCYVV